jgi:hypothetical protein
MDKISDDPGDLFPNIKLLIRSLQRIEGNPDCFGTSTGYCDQLECKWREYCLPEPKNQWIADRDAQINDPSACGP